MSLRVLVVDDSISTRALIGKTLETAGHTVLEAADGIAALEALSAGGFDVMITDQWMPNMTGLELVRAVRTRTHLAGLPILAITTDSEDDLRDEVMQAGASACILKPFVPAELLEAITTMVDG